MILRGILAAIAVAAAFRLAFSLADPRPPLDQIHRIVGSPSGRVPPPNSDGAMKIVTWNVEYGRRFHEIVGELRALAPDVILLQEVDRFCRRSGSRDIAHDLAQELGMNWLAAGEFQELGESEAGVPALTGQAILSRHPLADPRVIVFKDQARLRWRLNPFQPRRGGRMALGARAAGVLIYNVHIESGGNDSLRRRQLEDVLADADRQGDARVVVAGDFNNVVQERSQMFQPLAARGFVNARGQDARPTHVRHAYPIDWIFVKGSVVASGAVARIDGASDHYPVIATLGPAE
jgi:endonuclease/exonuclease/phosphatase family metal-dependent hydrolase